MRAIILAGGKGARLWPYTAVIPKPLVPVGERTVLEILIQRLVKSGVTDATLCVNHLANLIMAYFGDGSKWGLKIAYSIEDKPLSTVAPLKLIKDLPEHFLVINGDILTDLDYGQLFRRHLDKKEVLTVAIHRRKVQIDYGVLEVDCRRELATGFREKPISEFDVSMGVYVFSREVLDLVPSDRSFGFDDLMLTLLREKRNISVFSYEGYWLDIGRPDDYQTAINDLGMLNI